MRMHKHFGMCATILMLCGVANYGKAQTISYGMSELNTISSMRSEALGGATVALDGYPGAAQINPASIGRYHIIQGSSYFFGGRHGSIFGRQYGYGSVDLYQPSFDYRSDKWAAALLTTYYDLGEQTETDMSGNLLGRFRSHQLGISGSGSWEVSPDLRVGIGLRYITSNFGSTPASVGGTASHTAHSLAIDLGILYQKSFETEYVTLKPSAGWSLTNFGGPLQYSSTGSSDPLPTTMRGGIGLRLIGKKKMYDRPVFSVGIYGELSHILARKDADGNPYGPFKALFKGWSSYSTYSFMTDSNKRINFTDQFFTHLGMEVTLLGALSYRIGYINRPTALGYDTNLRMFGLGADLYYIMFDYTKISTVSGEFTGIKDQSIWQLTIRIPLEKPVGGIIPSLLN